MKKIIALILCFATLLSLLGFVGTVILAYFFHDEIIILFEKLFGVKVASVNTVTCKGKLKRMGRHEGYTPDRKKAIVQLKEDSKGIEFFDSLT